MQKGRSQKWLLPFNTIILSDGNLEVQLTLLFSFVRVVQSHL